MVTSLTVLLALGVLMLVGPEVIFGLAIAIFLGVLIGTYSSIYISAPVLVWLGVQPDSFVKADDKDEAVGPDGLTFCSPTAKLSPSITVLGLLRSPR